MSINLYDATVMNYLQTIGAIEGVLARGLEHCSKGSLDPQQIVETRIFPDMLPFRFQVGSVISHSLGAIEAARSGTYTPKPTPELDYAGLQKALGEARETLSKVSAEEVNGFAGKDVKFLFNERAIPFTAEGFLLSFSLPNFYFHASMAYAILRGQGVPLGKRDFMGQLRIKR
jgi:uncharacterized protein